MKAAEREERAADREMRKAELEREVRLRELEIRKKELEKGTVHVKSDSGLKTKLPKFHEGQDPDIFLRSFERLVVLHNIPKTEWALRLVPLLCGKALEAFSLHGYRRQKVEIMRKSSMLF